MIGTRVAWHGRHPDHMRTSTYAHDLRQEQLLQPYLDQCYAAHGISVERFHDREHQLKGVDVVLSKGGISYKVDEKAQLHYIGQRLPTFALEIDYMRNGEVRPGWLFDKRKATEVYAFVFDIVTGSSVALNEQPTSVHAEVILVNRTRLVSRLAASGLSEGMLFRISREVRSARAQNRSMRSPGVRLILSAQLNEEPVNLLVERHFLQSIGQVLSV